ncbi:alpha/beta hydrolase YcfP [Pasteurellaceae bacterium TAE3-ERU1]|uniref:alpha/beta hydrolase YcfP n=1 Tax=Spirabiliibacterium mucosae TaxID=28156 RepID=UPI001AADDD59|nr:alpha/beta hydrolase YcfP [Spirabiliibacterium mucosae]MBE2898292.1 alpha/beta hydrolase [Spirabiliibacterium mucosae]MBV7387193.1 alpha/beta hydrolase YcfP [Pasteurellaceae bacterium TAE3-ERU1]
MIIYLHGFDSSSPGNHEKIMQLKFIDPDVRFVNYSTLHPRHDMQFLLNEVHKLVTESQDESPLICGVGLGGYWAERIGFLCNIKQALFNPNLYPQENMQGKIDRPEEYEDIKTKCVSQFREKNRHNCIVFLSTHDGVLDSNRTFEALSPYYPIVWDEHETHKFAKISQHLQRIAKFKKGED